MQGRHQSMSDGVAEFTQRARKLDSRATLSPRHLQRLMAGEQTSARPGTRLVAEAVWGYSFDELVGPPLAASALPAARGVRTLHHSLSAGGAARPIDADGSVPLDEELLMAAEDSARFVRRAGALLTSEVLEQLEADVVSLAQQYLRRPPYTMFRPLNALRIEIFELLENHPRPAHSKELYRIGGLVSSLLAHLCSDLNQPYGVDTHTRAAWLCADLSGDDPQRAYILWVRSQVAYWQHEYARSADLARSGQQFARAGESMLRLVSQEARALAAMGDEHETTRVLRLAESSLEVAIDQRPAPGVFYFPTGKAAYYAAEAHIALGGPSHLRQAITDAEQSLALFAAGPEQSAELVAAAQLDLVTAHFGLGDLDSGAEHLRPIFQLPVASRTMPVIERTMKIAASLGAGQYAESIAAAQLLDQLDEFCAYTAAGGAPQLPA
jgi:hypothetical protein